LALRSAPIAPIQEARRERAFIAPTGKARVRVEQSTGHLKDYTIAQFLSPHRYNGAAGR